MRNAHSGRKGRVRLMRGGRVGFERGEGGELNTSHGVDSTLTLHASAIAHGARHKHARNRIQASTFDCIDLEPIARAMTAHAHPHHIHTSYPSPPSPLPPIPPSHLRNLPQPPNRTPRSRSSRCPAPPPSAFHSQHHADSKKHPPDPHPQAPKAAKSTSTYDTVHAPPATVFLQLLQLQMPTLCRLTVVLPQKVHV